MAQRYDTWPAALERMAQGTCPECGKPPSSHTGMTMFGTSWCSLREDGVVDRIAQFREDRKIQASADGTRAEIAREERRRPLRDRHEAERREMTERHAAEKAALEDEFLAEAGSS